MSLLFKKFWYLLFVLLLTNSAVIGQYIQTKQYSISDGLIQSRVNTINQDQFGRMWFGTVEGISIYDGSSFKSISEKTHRLPSEYIISSYFDYDSGTFWFGTIDNGLFSMKNDSLLKVYPFSEKTPWKRINSIDVWSNKLLVSTNNGIWIMDPQNGAVQSIELDIPDKRINDYIRISNNRLAFGTLSGIAITDNNFKIKTWLGRVEGLANTFIHSLLVDDQQRLLAGTRKGIVRITFAPKLKIDHIYNATSQPHPFVNVLYRSTENTIWAGTGQGIQILVEDRLKPYRIKDFFYRSIFQDREGNIWFGARGAGVVKLRDEMFVNYTLEDGLPNQEILSIHPQENGTVWYGTNKGLFELTDGKISSYTISKNTFSNIIADIHWFRGELYLSTWNGLFKKQNKTFQKINFRLRSGKYLRFSMLEVFNNRLVVSDRTSIYIYDGRNFVEVPFKKHFYIEELKVLKNTNILAVATQKKIFFFDKDFKNIKEIKLNNRQILSLIPIEGSSFYIGTDNGIILYDGHKIVEDLPGSEGLSQFEVLAGVFDNKRQLWMGTNSGLLKYRNGTYKRYTTQQGFIGDEIITNRSLARDHFGNIHIGTFIGFSICYPKKEKINEIPPNIRISDVELHERNLSVNATGIELSHDENSINFYYSGISFRDETELTYKYRLVGTDTSWSPPLKNNSIKFANLPYGDYLFQVLAINGDGIKSTVPASFRFSILAPIYLRPWFIGSLILFISFAAFYFSRRHLEKITNENIRLDQIVRKRTEQLQDEKDKLVSTNERLDKRTKELSDILAELKRTQNQLLQSEKLASLGRLINGIIEEINNPLAYIFTNTYHLDQYVDQLRIFIKELENSKSNRSLSKLLKEHDIDFIINDLDQIIKGFESTLTKVINILENLNSYGIRSTVFQDIDIKEEIEDSIYQVKKQFPEIDIEFSFNSEKLPKIKGSGPQLGQVFQSILRNSAENTAGRGKIKISAEHKQNKIIMLFADNGSGIDKKHLDKIFDPFFTTSEDPKKMGLGLAIAMSIISQHHGNIILNREIKEGTEISVEIPVADKTTD